MKFIEVQLADIFVRALLNEDGAPRTTAAIWDALPIRGSAAHATVSGQGFRLLGEIAVGDLPLEAATLYRHPGLISYYPPNKELGFCVGESRFALHRNAHTTPLAEIEFPFGDWAATGDDLQFSGARPLIVRRADDQETPFRWAPLGDRWLSFTFNGIDVDAALLPGVDQVIGQGFLEELRGTWRVTNSTWGGSVARVWLSDRLRQVVAAGSAVEQASLFHWKNYIYLHLGDGDLRICLADTQEYHRGQPAPMLAIAEIRGDLTAFSTEFGKLRVEGARDLAIDVLP